MPYYDHREVLAHGTPQSNVLLMNEAPGKNEAVSGIPLYGMQGANLYHSLYKTNIEWAIQHGDFIWKQAVDTLQKTAFLQIRETKITCTNSFNKWPKPNAESEKSIAPGSNDVLNELNIIRIRNEISANHTIILLCGKFSYLACTGTEITNPEQRECEQLSPEEIAIINNRLNSNIQSGWYMGHTRRWSLHQDRITRTLRSIAGAANWPIVVNNG